MKRNTKRKNEGITLIALVITIVVLLILAGVTISALTGDNSLIEQANKAKTETNMGKYREEIELIAIEEQKEITDFENLINNIKAKIEEKDYVESVTRKEGVFNTVLEVQTDIDKISVVFSNSDIEVAIGEVEIQETADENIFNYRENSEGKIEIIGFNFDNMEIEDCIVNDSIYQENQKGINIKNMPKLIIPNKIEEKDVVSVQFSENIRNGSINYQELEIITGITEIIYPKTVKEISGKRYKILNDVQKITLQEGLETLSSYAFFGMIKLKSITIPSSVKKLKWNIFYGCDENLQINILGKESKDDFEEFDESAFNISFYGTLLTNINYLGK